MRVLGGWQRWGRPRAWLLAVTVTAVVLLLRPTGRPSPQRWSELASPLTVTSLADGASLPDFNPASREVCLKRRRRALGRRTRITFLGNSRVRQVFETIVAQQRLRLLTRAEAAGRTPFVDEQLPLDWRHFADDNSTCVGVWPKGRPKNQPARAWCSHLAVGGGLELEFRWRNAMYRFVDALRLLESGCARGLPCPDILVVNQGLHFVVKGRFGRLLPVFREYLEDCIPVLRQLTARGMRVLWMFEHPANPRIGQDSFNDDTLVLNALVAEVLGSSRRVPGVVVWTSQSSAVTRFWSRTCYGLIHIVSQEEHNVCANGNYHVSNRTLSVMAEQLMNFVCETEGKHP